MKKGDRNTTNGFTVIEVALVLAIAGLIFLMVFVALPGLRASQRDTDRREHVIKFLEAVKKYQTNNRGALPGGSDTGDSISVVWSGEDPKISETTWAGFYRDYLGANFVDPSGENYKLQILDCGVPQVDQPCKTSNPNQVLAEMYDRSISDKDIGYTIVVVKQATCSGDGAVASSNPRKLAALYKLEGAGVYCSNT